MSINKQFLNSSFYKVPISQFRFLDKRQKKETEEFFWRKLNIAKIGENSIKNIIVERNEEGWFEAVSKMPLNIEYQSDYTIDDLDEEGFTICEDFNIPFYLIIGDSFEQYRIYSIEDLVKNILSLKDANSTLNFYKGLFLLLVNNALRAYNSKKLQERECLNLINCAQRTHNIHDKVNNTLRRELKKIERSNN